MAIEVDLICPHCGDKHDRTTLATPDLSQESPEDGDISACSSCGAFSVFDSTAPGGLRAPFDAEIDVMGRAKFELLQHTIQQMLIAGRTFQ